MIIFFSLSLSFFLLDMLYIESNDSANAQEQEEEKKTGKLFILISKIRTRKQKNRRRCQSISILLSEKKWVSSDYIGWEMK